MKEERHYMYELCYSIGVLGLFTIWDLWYSTNQYQIEVNSITLTCLYFTNIRAIICILNSYRINKVPISYIELTLSIIGALLLCIIYKNLGSFLLISLMVILGLVKREIEKLE